MKIRSLLSAFGLAAFAASAQAGPPMGPPDLGPAPSDDLGMTIAVAYDSSYVFRGVDFGDHLVSAEIDKSFTLTEQLGLDLGVWYASLADEDYDELDVFATLTYDLGFAEVGVGYTWYYFPRTEDDTGEIGASIAKSIGIVDLGVAYYYDYEALDGHYIEASAGTSYKITDRLSLQPSVSVAYEVGYNTTSDGWSNVGLRLALPYALSDRAVLSPYIAGNIPLDVLEDVGEDDKVYGGVSLSVSF